MAKLGSKREHVRGWTASTFLPDGESSTSPSSSPTTLDAISENAMDEDLLQDDEAAQSLLGATTNNLASQTGDADGSGSDAVDSDSENEDDYDDDDDDGDHDDQNHEEDDGSGSSQDQGTSEDSDDDPESIADQGEGSSEPRERIGVPKRSRTGVASKKRSGSLSTSPSNPSKLISATPTKKITKKSKKSVKSKSSKGLLSTAAARQASEEAKLEAAKPIVSRFLELENTKLNDKLLQVFMINEIAKDLGNGMDDDANQESKFMTRVEQCRRTRDYSDINLMKRSYTAMNFITRSDVYNEFILSSSHQAIVKELFKIFRPESNGNFYHFQKVFETILKKFRAQTMATLFEDVDPESGLAKTPMIFDMLPFLDQMPVALSMTKVLFPTYTYGFAEKINDYYRILQNGHFMEMLLAMVTLTKEPSANMADFVVSLLDEATKAKDAKVIFSCLADDPIWTERLTQGIQSTSAIRRHGCIEIIYSVLVRRSFERVESHLERISNEFGKHLAAHIPDLCLAFIGSKSNGEKCVYHFIQRLPSSVMVTLPGYIVSSSFTVARLWLLDSIYHCLNDVKDNPKLLGSIPEEFWSVLVDSFFQFRFNNAFHVQFYKLFRVVLYSEQTTVYQRFFVKPNLTGRLMEHYQATSQPTGSRGYIILILNCIRLSADVEKRNTTNGTTVEAREGTISRTFWIDLLGSISEWEGFQTTLREATLEQTRDTLCDMDPNLRFQFAPLQSRQPSEAPLTKRHIGIPGVSARGNDGIDLGSQYGNSLGFGVPMKYDRAADEQAKKQSEQDHELQVQKALANLMPNVDWKLIPPQRVINAMIGMNKGKALGNGKQDTNGSASSAGDNSKGAKGSEDGSVTGSNDAAPTTSKSKKKKKNKKKRQISSINNSEDTTEEDDNAQGRGSTNDSSADQNDGKAESSRESSEAEGSQSSSETNGEHSDSKSAAVDSEEERLKRKKEKNREKKRKSKMNKKNKTLAEGQSTDTEPSNEGDGAATETEPQLSVGGEKLLQNIMWATVVSPPTETSVWIEHNEFKLEISKRPWKLPLKYDIEMGGEVVEAKPYKLQFTLQSPK
ncbi:hypothetical protein BGX26_010501 [Mortierella sp. AD094]|nr:hypothetical protein BGX26_010501 [Mortierella sp. AD094]